MHILEAAQYISQIEELTLIIMYIKDSLVYPVFHCIVDTCIFLLKAIENLHIT